MGFECCNNLSGIYDIHIVGTCCALGGTGGTAAVWHLGHESEERANSLPSTRASTSSGAPTSTCSSGGTGAFNPGTQACMDNFDSMGLRAQLLPDGNADLKNHGLGSKIRHGEESLIIFEHAKEKQVAVNCVCISSDTRHLASGGTDCKVLFWCISSQEILKIFYHHLPPSSCGLCTACVNALRFAPDDVSLVAGGYDGVVTVWELPRSDPIAEH